MKILAIALFATGITAFFVGSAKYRAETEWEHWAAKLTWLSVLGFGLVLAGVGAVMLLVA
ncbi:MAG: hypothetical protein RMI34_04030 [Chloroherpetonaceae bacterium]|nr:hypothetical protein [Chloroherpetonaceae bacterium]MCS7211920.1 hypothetical protein [Chloroherpetonaceae bacterium]MDW8019228.1 hypothetical protein [Chloroherpetonaceae bacterium]MDW8464786.1 hypothetical protein [Chloroherpetonaceae bacterium]